MAIALPTINMVGCMAIVLPFPLNGIIHSYTSPQHFIWPMHGNSSLLTPKAGCIAMPLPLTLYGRMRGHSSPYQYIWEKACSIALSLISKAGFMDIIHTERKKTRQGSLADNTPSTN